MLPARALVGADSLLGAAGGSASAIGFVVTHLQRTARFSAPLRMKWIWRIRRGRERLAGMQFAALIAPAFAQRAVVDLPPARLAVVSAPAELGVEPVHGAGVERSDLWSPMRGRMCFLA